MHVRLELLPLAPHDHRGLRMVFHADETGDHVTTRFLQLPRPADVVLLVEARLQLDESDHLLSFFRGPDERVGHR